MDPLTVFVIVIAAAAATYFAARPRRAAGAAGGATPVAVDDPADRMRTMRNALDAPDPARAGRYSLVSGGSITRDAAGNLVGWSRFTPDQDPPNQQVRDGRDGRDGLHGRDGRDPRDGRDGRDGFDRPPAPPVAPKLVLDLNPASRTISGGAGGAVGYGLVVTGAPRGTVVTITATIPAGAPAGITCSILGRPAGDMTIEAGRASTFVVRVPAGTPTTGVNFRLTGDATGFDPGRGVIGEVIINP